MPIPVKNPKPFVKPSGKKHTKEQLEKVLRDKLKIFCRRKNLPYCRLTKSQLIENILLWEDSKDIAHPELVRTWEETQAANHRITPQIRRFCYDYATCIIHKTHKQWAKQFNVSTATINVWMATKEIKDLIESLHYGIEKRMTEVFVQNQEGAVLVLVQIMMNPRTNAEVRRKAANDLLGFAGRININATKTIVNQAQGQAVQNNDYSKMSEKEIDQALKEMDYLDED